MIDCPYCENSINPEEGENECLSCENTFTFKENKITEHDVKCLVCEKTIKDTQWHKSKKVCEKCLDEKVSKGGNGLFQAVRDIQKAEASKKKNQTFLLKFERGTPEHKRMLEVSNKVGYVRQLILRDIER